MAETPRFLSPQNPRPGRRRLSMPIGFRSRAIGPATARLRRSPLSQLQQLRLRYFQSSDLLGYAHNIGVLIHFGIGLCSRVTVIDFEFRACIVVDTTVKKKVEDVMPIATGHEREEIEAVLEVNYVLFQLFFLFLNVCILLLFG